MKNIITLFILFLSVGIMAQQENLNNNKFKQLQQELPTPNTYRNASGAPGVDYWQMKADYDMKIRLDDTNQRLYGEETIVYHNLSPDPLNYLWMQLDQNVRALDSDAHAIGASAISDRTNVNALKRLEPSFDGGHKIDYVKDMSGKDLHYVINNTMMRIDMPKTLKPNEKFAFKVKWWYNINNTKKDRGRSGFEHFAEDDNNVYVIAQFFPRMCQYNDVDGWQNKQFYGRGEFTLTFGDYNVEITVPADHLVAATGENTNQSDLLSKDQKKRLKEAMKGGEEPITIATKEEADERMKKKSTKEKTWKFKAKNVRDFAFASSRRFIWDAIGVPMADGSTVMAASMWVKEGDCLWKKYSTRAVAHTIKWFSHYTFDYPYPVAWSIDGSMGMEYPMICFNYGRCNEDGETYEERMMRGHVSVIIHEVGHNWFPMIVNSDERQWTWMDEGLCSYVQHLAEVEWEADYPSRRGPAHKITSYMGGDKARISPIMTNSESIWQFGNNAYGKPATALNILRETVVGRELFDYAFKEYSNRWKFKSPQPADLFRTLEDATAMDLDWFWRGWFYTNDNVDISIDTIRYLTLKDIVDPETFEKADEELKGKHYVEIKFSNVGGLVMPLILEFEFEDGTKEIQRIPAEIWRMGKSQMVTKVFVKDKPVKQIILDPNYETADTDPSNNSFPRLEAEEKTRFQQFKDRKRKITP